MIYDQDHKLECCLLILLLLSFRRAMGVTDDSIRGGGDSHDTVIFHIMDNHSLLIPYADDIMRRDFFPHVRVGMYGQKKNVYTV